MSEPATTVPAGNKPKFKLKSYDEMSYHPVMEKLVEHICKKTENDNPLFFRVHVSYYLSVLAAMMGTKVETVSRDAIPINMYAINLATSGAGKGKSTNIIEDDVINQFLYVFKESSFGILAERNLGQLANDRAARDNIAVDEALKQVEREFVRQGPLQTVFDSGSMAAIKQIRHKLLMADIGSINFQMDELGDNLLSNAEAFAVFLEMFDVGKTKSRAYKQTSESSREEEIDGRIPANMMLFGTPSRLFAGDKVEDEFYTMLQKGYARRCFFGYSLSHTSRETDELDIDEYVQSLRDKKGNTMLSGVSQKLARLSDPSNAHRTIPLSDDAARVFAQYSRECNINSGIMPEHDEVPAAELRHRAFKTLKLAGAYAFIDNSPEVTEDHAYQAIKLAEDSAKAFNQLLNRDKPYVKLAKYIAAIKRNVTQVDLVEDLPFYKGSNAQKNDMMQLAIAYGYQNNILIKKAFTDGIEFIRGETLEETNLDKMIVSHSQELAHNYKDEYAPFDKLHNLTQLGGMHWTNHFLKAGHRCEENAIPGFNMIVIDVDGGIDMRIAQDLLKDYKALFYTTKSHTKDQHRFRIVMPTNYVLKLDAADFKEFMRNVFDWLPFEVDDVTGQRSRKWASHSGQYCYQDGQLLDVLPFIPKTSKNETRKALLNDQASLDNLERWVINNTGDGNRNNQLLRYGMLLVDGGFEFDAVHTKVMSLNDKLPDKLPEAEILSTIMKTVTTAIGKRAQKTASNP